MADDVKGVQALCVIPVWLNYIDMIETGCKLSGKGSSSWPNIKECLAGAAAIFKDLFLDDRD